MPIYPYSCDVCHHYFDVIKPMGNLDDSEYCKICGGPAFRGIAHTAFIGGGDWIETYNPAFGCVVKSKRHQRQILADFKAKGKEFVEIGNEPVENIHKNFEKQREQKRLERWSESHEKILGEALK